MGGEHIFCASNEYYIYMGAAPQRGRDDGDEPINTNDMDSASPTPLPFLEIHPESDPLRGPLESL